MRLIDVERFCADNPNFNSKVYVSLSKAPTIDAVPVVRCKDCENWDADCAPAGAEDGEHFCLVFAYTSMPDDFCSHGKRRCDNE